VALPWTVDGKRVGDLGPRVNLKPMRLVVHDFGGYPFSAQLSRVLAERGNQVLYLRSRGFRPPKDGPEGADDPEGLTSDAVDIGRTASNTLGPSRLADERRYGTELARRITQFEPDVVLSANCPTDAQSAAQASAHNAGAGFVFWLQDIYSEAVGKILRRRLPVAGHLIGARFARLERRLLLASEAIVSISPDFLPLLKRWGARRERVTVIENWSPLDELVPLPKQNDWSIQHGLDDRPVFLYAGTLGRKHDPGLLLALARAVPSACVVVISEGSGTEWLRRHATEVQNLRLLRFQPYARLSEVLASADVLVALLQEDAGPFSVPSKVLTYLGAGRPILAAMPPANLAARMISDTGAGSVVPPTDRGEFIKAAKDMMNNAEARSHAGAAGRAYAEKAFDIGPIADRFESALTAAISDAPVTVGKALDTAHASLNASSGEATEVNQVKP
jgi:colanic acid biosynthesis glycosyl transferase WcaI